MPLIIKVRDHYTLQVGKDPANWIRGPKRVKIRDKQVIAGQMHKVEILQDDGSPDPVIVRGNLPAGTETGDTGGARAGFGAQAAVEELLKKPESDEVARENERQRREVSALQLMAESDKSAQEAARERVLDAARVEQESTAKHSAAGIIEEVPDDYVLSAEDLVVTKQEPVTVDEITSRARPMTSRLEDSVLEVEDVPTPEEVNAAPVIGENAEARAEEAAKPKLQRITVEGVDPAKLKRALALVASGALGNVDEATRMYEAVQKGLVVVKKPTEYRDELEAHAKKTAADLVEAADTLVGKNKDLDAAYESLRGKVVLLEADNERLHNDPAALELRTKIGELETDLAELRGKETAVKRDNDALRGALAKSEKNLRSTTEGRDAALQKLADGISKAKKKTSTKKKASTKKEEANAGA